MIRSTFENQLQDLTKNVILMGAFCEDIISKSVQVLKKENPSLVNDVTKTYQKIEQFERDIEEQCLKILLRQQPVAKDLRRVSAALKMVYDMKRIGAQASEISEIVNQGHIKSGVELEYLQKMVAHVVRMVTTSVDAFVYNDEKLANRVISYDNTVDQDFDTIKVNLMTYFSGDDVDGEYAIDVLMVAKYIERIGDHTVNIAKWVIFSITGQLDGDDI
ncbi:phosphate transport system protein [Streptococcus equinus]|uniref:Phosphate-specific transport system accessory protein PhoU n=1 Tax=Streptococcus equinus TaxID=1335 RepID=A0A1H0ZJE9_STREI|nr:phosphate signaling complex protein PhoU [Streptococcus equinus]SDQ27474.1 phosphate transport system protein [Streptococcus equinus]